jgi:hypothetical protein
VSNDGINKGHTTPRPQARTGAVLSHVNDGDGDDTNCTEDDALGVRRPPPDPTKGLTAAEALRYFASAADNAERDRLATEALPQIEALAREIDRIEAEVLEANKLFQSSDPYISAHAAFTVSNRQRELNRAQAAEWMALSALETLGPLADLNGRMWQNVVALGEQGVALFTAQASSPFEPRQTLPPDNLHLLRFPHLSVLWGGTPEHAALARRARIARIRAIGDNLAPLPANDTWLLDDHWLRRGRILLAVGKGADLGDGATPLAWLRQYFRNSPRAKRDDAFRDCHDAIGATWPQMREAIKLVPNRRTRGKHD